MSVDALQAHLATGTTHICQCWAIARHDGVTFGFTDHDLTLTFDGITFAADSGMSAKALAASTGLSVNNTEAVGLLQSDVIRDSDIAAGRYDNAQVTMWQVCWDDVTAREVKFYGTIGEITRRSGTFQAELLGLTDALNQPQGRTYLRSCGAVLGDRACTVDLTDAAYYATCSVLSIGTDGAINVALEGFDDGWFAGGKVTVLDGDPAGLIGAIKTDVLSGGVRKITLWSNFGVSLSVGQNLRLTAGCDRSLACCRDKFANILNFQGFPDIPGEDWLVSVPRSDDPNTGGSILR